MTIHIENETQLGRFAAHLAACLQPPCVLALSGPLGAGKTAFVRAFVDALVRQHNTKPLDNIQVSSPTYALANTYPTQPVVHHLDLYRLDNLEHVWDLGLGELMQDEQAFVCVEWPSAFVKTVAVSRWIHMQLSITALARPHERRVQLEFSQECPQAWYDVIANCFTTLRA